MTLYNLHFISMISVGPDERRKNENRIVRSL